MTLDDLYNPKRITGFLHKDGNYYEAGENQAFQLYKKSIELWETREGLLYRLKRWLSKSIIATYTKRGE